MPDHVTGPTRYGARKKRWGGEKNSQLRGRETRKKESIAARASIHSLRPVSECTDGRRFGHWRLGAKARDSGAGRKRAETTSR